MALLTKRDYDAITLLASTTAAASGNGSAVRLPGMVRAYAFVLDVTAAATEADDTLDVTVETKVDGTNWTDVVAFTQVVGNGGAKRHVAKIVAGVAENMYADGTLAAGSIKNLLGDDWRVTYTIAEGASGATASFTFSVACCPM